MKCLKLAQIIGFVVLIVAASQVGNPRSAYGNVTCYQSITDIPCPSAPVTEDCATQFNALPPADKVWNPNGKGDDYNISAKTNCEKLIYAGRFIGPFGEGGKNACLSLTVPTGTRCVPETDADGFVIRVVCGNKYKCVWGGTNTMCQRAVDAYDYYRSDNYKLSELGCMKKMPGGE